MDTASVSADELKDRLLTQADQLWVRVAPSSGASHLLAWFDAPPPSAWAMQGAALRW